MPYLNDRVFDNGLTIPDTEANSLHICSEEPSTYTEATSTYTLGNKSTPTVSAPADRAGGGREVTVSAIADGSVTADGTATHYALVDTGNSRLLVAQALDSSVGVTDGNNFTLTEFTVGIPDPS